MINPSERRSERIKAGANPTHLLRHSLKPGAWLAATLAPLSTPPDMVCNNLDPHNPAVDIQGGSSEVTIILSVVGVRGAGQVKKDDEDEAVDIALDSDSDVKRAV